MAGVAVSFIGRDVALVGPLVTADGDGVAPVCPVVAVGGVIVPLFRGRAGNDHDGPPPPEVPVQTPR